MFRKLIAVSAIAGSLALGGASMAMATDAPAPSTPAKTNPLKCVGATEHRSAQGLRQQALQADLAALNARRSAAVTAGLKPERIARIDAHIARVNARIATVTANQAKLNAKCPA